MRGEPVRPALLLRLALARHSHVERGVAAAVRPHPRDHGRGVGHLPAAVLPHRHHAVPGGRPAEGAPAGPGAAHPDGDPRLLQRGRVADGGPVRARDPVVGAGVLDGLSAPQPVQDLEVLVEHGPPDGRVRLLPAVVPLEREGAAPDPEDEPPAAQTVQRGGLASHDQRPASGQRRDQRPEPDGVRGAGGGGQRHPGVHHVHRTGSESEQVVPEEEAVPAGGLGLDRPLRHQGRVQADSEAGHRQTVSHVPNLSPGRPSWEGWPGPVATAAVAAARPPLLVKVLALPGLGRHGRPPVRGRPGRAQERWLSRSSRSRAGGCTAPGTSSAWAGTTSWPCSPMDNKTMDRGVTTVEGVSRIVWRDLDPEGLTPASGPRTSLSSEEPPHRWVRGFLVRRGAGASQIA